MFSQVKQLPWPARLMLTSLVFDFIGTGLIMPFGVVYLNEVRGFSLETAGLLLGLPAVIGLLTVGPGGVLIDRIGARRVVILAVALELAAQVVMANAHSVPVAALSLVMSGTAVGSIFPAVQGMVAAILPSQQRPLYFGLSFTILNLGMGIGGVLGGWLVDVHRPSTFEALYYIDALTFVLPLVLYLGPLRAYGNRPRPGDRVDPGAAEESDVLTEASTPGGYRAVWGDTTMRLLIIVGFMTAFIGYAQFGVGFQAFARREAGVSTQVLGWAYACNTAVIVIGQLLILRFVAGRRRTRSLMAMCGLWVVSWGVMAAAGPTSGTTAAVLVCVSAGVFGIGEMFLQPTLPAMVNDLAPDELRGRYNSASAAAFHLAEILGPPFAGLMIGYALGGWYPIVLIAGCVLAAAVTLRVEGRIPAGVNGVGGPVELPNTDLTHEVQQAKGLGE